MARQRVYKTKQRRGGNGADDPVIAFETIKAIEVSDSSKVLAAIAAAISE